MTAAPLPRHSAAAAPAAPDPIEMLVRRHVRGVFRYLRMLGARPEEADDLAQDAFVLALQKGAVHLEAGAAGAWLRRCARNLLWNARRRSRAFAVLADAVDQLWARDCERDDGDAQLDAVRDCLRELPPRTRRAVELAYGIGDAEVHSRAGIAAALDLQENGVKTLLQRARAALRACIRRRLP